MRLWVGVDSADGAALLAAAVPGLEVLVEVDSGHHRTGVAPHRGARSPRPPDRRACRSRVSSPSRGTRTRLGSKRSERTADTAPARSADRAKRGSAVRGKRAATDEAAALSAAADALRAVGIEPRVRSGGSTPTAALSTADVLTELRPGVYAFQDAQQAELGSTDLADIALTAVATVVSRGRDRAVLDAGSKVLGADRPAWTTGSAGYPTIPTPGSSPCPNTTPR